MYNTQRQKDLSLLQGCGVGKNWGVRKWYIPPPPGVFRKDINPWELLTNFLQRYHSKGLSVIFRQNWFRACFCRLQVRTPPWERKPERSGFCFVRTHLYFTGWCKYILEKCGRVRAFRRSIVTDEPGITRDRILRPRHLERPAF